MARTEWFGDRVLTRVAKAAIIGTDATMADAVHRGRANHPGYPPPSAPGQRYHSRTGHAEASIAIFDHAGWAGLRVGGQWGSDANYSLYLEIGTSRKDSGAPRAQEREAMGDEKMWAIPQPSIPPQMAARYTLRPAASQAYVLYGARIGAAYRGDPLP